MKDHISILRSLSKDTIPNIDFHLHTNWTDGQASVLAMHESAIKENLDFILFSEHVRTNSKWFEEYEDQIRQLPKTKCHAFVGAESRIEDFYGNVDCSTLIKNHCDFLIASVHRFPEENNSSYRSFSEIVPEQALEIEYRLTSAAIENPWVDIIGHLFGMSLTKYKKIPPVEMILQLVKKAAKYNVAIEINSSYHINPWLLINLCKQEGTLFTLGSDAHCIEDVGKIVKVLKGERAS